MTISGIRDLAALRWAPRLAVLGFVLLCQLSCSTASAPSREALDEESVKPGVNDRFLNPEMDLEWAVNTFEGESREISAHREAIAAALELAPGASVADIGAGTGLFFAPFAARIGPEGKIHAVDISPRLVEHMRKRCEQEGLSQVEVVLGDARSANLPAGSVDVAFTCDTYHHFEFPKSMLESIHEALRPGGLLYILDFERIPGVSRDWVIGHVRAGKEQVTQEVVEAGFEPLGEIEVEGLEENYLLGFRRP